VLIIKSISLLSYVIVNWYVSLLSFGLTDIGCEKLWEKGTLPRESYVQTMFGINFIKILVIFG
jgi:hypothetical protein